MYIESMPAYILQDSHFALCFDFDHLTQVTLRVSWIILQTMRLEHTLATAVVTVAIDLT